MTCVDLKVSCHHLKFDMMLSHIGNIEEFSTLKSMRP